MATYRIQALTPWLSTETSNAMLIAEEYPASWTDITWQADALIGIGKLDRLVVLGEGLSAQQMADIQADARFAVLWLEEDGVPVTDYTPEQVETVRAEVTAILSSDVARMVTEDTVAAETIAGRVKEAVLYPPFVVGEDVLPGDIRYWKGNLFRVLQAHRTQSDWTPDVARSLFVRYYEPSDDPWPWVQPTGAHDAYPKDARVLHKDAIWISQIDANVWEPGSVGAEALWVKESGEEPEQEWRVGVQYTGDNTAGAGKGDVVTYSGRRYRCWQTHISQIGWEPSKVPALWIDLGPI